MYLSLLLCFIARLYEKIYFLKYRGKIPEFAVNGVFPVNGCNSDLRWPGLLLFTPDISSCSAFSYCEAF